MARIRHLLAPIAVLIVALAALGGSGTLHPGGAHGVPLAATDAVGATVQGQSVNAGDTIPVLTLIASELRMTGVGVTSASTVCGSGAFRNGQCIPSVQATGTLTVGSDATPLAVALDYQGDADWTVTITAGSAGGSYSPPLGAPIDLNQLSGTITMANGVAST
ncbi:MAG: hypothetical protein ACPGN4_03165, partial [Miltoncostaeaceae bacterium]